MKMTITFGADEIKEIVKREIERLGYKISDLKFSWSEGRSYYETRKENDPAYCRIDAKVERME
jgi:hypothetical protein